MYPKTDQNWPELILASVKGIDTFFLLDYYNLFLRSHEIWSSFNSESYLNCLIFCIPHEITASESLKSLQKCFGDSTLLRTTSILSGPKHSVKVMKLSKTYLLRVIHAHLIMITSKNLKSYGHQKDSRWFQHLLWIDTTHFGKCFRYEACQCQTRTKRQNIYQTRRRVDAKKRRLTT